MTESEGGYLLVGTRDKPWQTHPYGHVWRFWTRGTSFYVKARSHELGAIKVSLHGPDERTTVGPPGFKYGFDGRDADRTGSLHAEGFIQRWYAGERIDAHVRRVLRVRIPWDTLRPGDPPGAGKTSLTKRMDGGIVKVPAMGYAVDLDFFVSDRAPYWPASAEQMAQDSAGFGPYSNDAGQKLTIASIHRSMHRHPSPKSAHAIPPMNRADAVRGAYWGINEDADPEDAFPWVVETIMSRRALTDLDAYRLPHPVRPVPFARPTCSSVPLTLT